MVFVSVMRRSVGFDQSSFSFCYSYLIAERRDPMIWLFALVLIDAVWGLRYADRNNSHLLFEYLFTQNECDQGVFAPHGDVHGVSFGNLTRLESLRCLDRNGYSSAKLRKSQAFRSEGTMEALKNHTVEKKALSFEFWLRNYPNNDVLAPMFAMDFDAARNQYDSTITVLLMGDRGYLFVTTGGNSIQSHEFIDFAYYPNAVHIVITADFQGEKSVYNVKDENNSDS